MLIFTLPAKRASERVEVWRNLKRSGALQMGTSGYLLPFSAANQERFEWLASAIRTYKGQASVVQAHSIDDAPDDELRQRFLQARAGEYEELMREARKLAKAHGANTAARLRRRLEEIASVDFFNSPLRSRAEAMLARVGPPAEAGAPARGVVARRDSRTGPG